MNEQLYRVKLPKVCFCRGVILGAEKYPKPIYFCVQNSCCDFLIGSAFLNLKDLTNN